MSCYNMICFYCKKHLRPINEDRYIVTYYCISCCKTDDYSVSVLFHYSENKLTTIEYVFEFIENKESFKVLHQQDWFEMKNDKTSFYVDIADITEEYKTLTDFSIQEIYDLYIKHNKLLSIR